MKRKERAEAFQAFYQKTYKTAMNFFLSKTGDFLNTEDLLAKAYIAVYQYFLKSKKIDDEKAERYFHSALKKSLAKYSEKHKKARKPSAERSETAPDKLLEKEFDLTAETAEQRMLLHDILAFVSQKPLAERRAFTYHIYFGKSIEGTAEELNLPVSEVKSSLSALLAEIEETFLAEFE